MLNVINHRNENKNHNVILPHTCQNGHHQWINKLLEKIWIEENTCALLVELQIDAAIWKTECSFFKKLKLELPCDPAIWLMCIYEKKSKTLIWRNICPPMFIAALFLIAKLWEQSKCPSELPTNSSLCKKPRNQPSSSYMPGKWEKIHNEVGRRG